MNRKLFYLSGIFLLIFFSCKKEVSKEKETVQKNPKKYSFVVKRNTGFIDTGDLQQDEKLKDNDFFKILESFQPQSFSLDELIDLTEKDLKLIKKIQTSRFNNLLDTAAVKSRLVLTEVYLRKLNYLIHKKKPQKDTIAGTLNAIVQNLNNVTAQMKIYNNSTDEFESILKHDSIARQQRQLFNDSLPKTHQLPNVMKKNNKKRKIRLKNNFPFKKRIK